MGLQSMCAQCTSSAQWCVHYQHSGQQAHPQQYSWSNRPTVHHAGSAQTLPAVAMPSRKASTAPKSTPLPHLPNATAHRHGTVHGVRQSRTAVCSPASGTLRPQLSDMLRDLAVALGDSRHSGDMTTVAHSRRVTCASVASVATPGSNSTFWDMGGVDSQDPLLWWSSSGML